MLSHWKKPTLVQEGKNIKKSTPITILRIAPQMVRITPIFPVMLPALGKTEGASKSVLSRTSKIKRVKTPQQVCSNPSRKILLCFAVKVTVAPRMNQTIPLMSTAIVSTPLLAQGFEF